MQKVVNEKLYEIRQNKSQMLKIDITSESKINSKKKKPEWVRKRKKSTSERIAEASGAQ